MRFVIDPEKCVACFACARVCPTDAVAVDGERAAIVDESCILCGDCVPSCPHQAIDAVGELGRALRYAAEGDALIILNVDVAAHFFPMTPEQVVNACHSAGFIRVHRGVVGDELVAREYLAIWEDEDWGTLIRSTNPIVVDTIERHFPELLPYLAPVVTPIEAESRYLRAIYGDDQTMIYAAAVPVHRSDEIDACITFSELAQLFRARGVEVERQPQYFDRIPDQRARHWSTAGGMPMQVLAEERQASRRFRKVRDLGQLAAISRAITIDRQELGFIDLLPSEGSLDHPLQGPREELYWRRQVVASTEPPRSEHPVVDEALRIELAAAFRMGRNGKNGGPPEENVQEVLEEIGEGPNGRPWDCGACGFATCREFALAAVRGRATLRQCPPYQQRRIEVVKRQADQDALTGLSSIRVLQERLTHEIARSGRSGEPFAVLFVDLDDFKAINDRNGHEFGNEVLRAVAREISECVRSVDLACRYGGDEFVVLLVQTGESGARRVGEAVREAVGGLGPSLGLGDRAVTVSVGVSAFEPGARSGLDPLVAADRALYAAKAKGRDAVV